MKGRSLLAFCSVCDLELKRQSRAVWFVYWTDASWRCITTTSKVGKAVGWLCSQAGLSLLMISVFDTEPPWLEMNLYSSNSAYSQDWGFYMELLSSFLMEKFCLGCKADCLLTACYPFLQWFYHASKMYLQHQVQWTVKGDSEFHMPTIMWLAVLLHFGCCLILSV